MNDQDQVDIGDDINERELDALERHGMGIDRTEPHNDGEPDEPTAEALAGALFAQLGYVVSDIGEAETMAVIVDGDRETLTLDLHKLDNALQQLGVVRDEIAQALAALMEGELEAIAGFAVKRTKSEKVEWDRDAVWRSLRAALIDRWAMRGQEVDPSIATLVDRVITDVRAVYTSPDPTVKGLKALAVNPYEYRSTTPATRWTVKVTA